MSRPFDFGSGDEPVGGADDRRPVPAAGAPSSGFGGFSAGESAGSGFGTMTSTDTGAGSGFGGFDPHADGAVAVGQPPVRWLYAGIAGAVIGVVTAALFAAIVPAVAAWLLAGPVAIGFLTVFILGDNKSRSAPIYSVRSFVPWLYRGLLVVSLVGVVLGALRIAVWVGHL